MTKKNKSQSRGWRLNNPCCIRKGTAWKGLAEIQSDKEFCTFVAPVYGFRAAVIIICKTYYGRKRVTIRQIIESWAPPSENDTEAYVAHVAKAVGIGADVMLPRPKYRDDERLGSSHLGRRPSRERLRAQRHGCRDQNGISNGV